MPHRLPLSLVLACAVSAAGAATARPPVHRIAPEAQRAGDASAGKRYVLDGDYVGCGVPDKLYRQAFGHGGPRVAGRGELSADLPYAFTRFTDRQTGARVVAANCLLCHAAPLPGSGKLTFGLGNPNLDFTTSQGDAPAAAQLGARLGLLRLREAEQRSLARWSERVVKTAPYLITRSVGANPADNLAAALFAHRDPKTLAWSDTPLLEPPPTTPVPTDVPPWWGMRKKNAMFYTAAGRGDHARIMMSASALCTETTSDAERVDEHMGDVRAYIAQLPAPRWPWHLDKKLAARGEKVFTRRCSSCHGSYGEDARYPNLWVELDEVGTDRALAESPQRGDRFARWFNQSWFGETARFEPQPGYVAPPLDGVWATAPYLHNGSVPTLAALLDSTQRPLLYRRAVRAREYDRDAVGWPATSLSRAQLGELPPAARAGVWDTSVPGYGAGGHTYGDKLSPADRRALLEYLKTL